MSILSLLFARQVMAGEPPAGSAVKVTWPELVRLVEQHPRLAVGNSQIDAARAGVRVAGAVPNPGLETTVGQGRARSGDGSRVEWGLALNLPLGWIAQRQARISAAEAEVDVAVAESRTLRREVLLALRTLFWNLAYEQARVAAFEALEAQTITLVETVQRRVEKGEARPVEATRVEIELDRVRNELDAARTALSSRQAVLALWLRAPAGQSVVAVADLGTLPVAIDRDSALAKARAIHPTLLVAWARTQALAAELDSEKRARVPSVSLTGFTAHELDRRAFGVGMGVTLPVWNWNAGGIAQAQAKLAAGRKQTEALMLEVETTIIDAQAACQASLVTASRLGASMVPRSELSAATMERTYQLGEARLLEVIDARRTLLESRRLHLSALAQAHIDCARLGVLIGEEMP